MADVFMTGQQIYENFAHAVGTTRLAAGAKMAGDLVEEFHQTADDIHRLCDAMATAWQGDAADMASGAAESLRLVHVMAEPLIHTATDLTNRQVDSFAAAKNSVVPVPPEPATPDPWAMIFTESGTTYAEQVAAHQEAALHNVEVMRAYESASAFNAQGQPQSFGTITPEGSVVVLDAVADVVPPPTIRFPLRGQGAPSNGPHRTSSETSSTHPNVANGTANGSGGTSSAGAGPVSGSGGDPGDGAKPGVGGGVELARLDGPAGGRGLDNRAEPGRLGGPEGGQGQDRGRGLGSDDDRGLLGGLDSGLGPGGEPRRGRGPDAGRGRFSGPESGRRPASERGVGGGERGGSAGPVGGGRGRGRGDGGDVERLAAEYLREADPESVFGTDEKTTPPVIE